MIKITSIMILTYTTVLSMILTMPDNITLSDVIFLSLIALILLIILSPVVLQFLKFKEGKENKDE